MISESDASRHGRPCRPSSTKTGRSSNSRRSTHAFPSASASMAGIASRRSARRTSSSTTPTKASKWWWSSCGRRPLDPDVVAIKQTLYRAGKQSAVMRALIDAAEAGKSVTAVIELKARFDEEQNLLWANALERAGVQVVYGFVDWKTHAKVSMVVRREAKGYPHLLPLRNGQLSPGDRAHLHRRQLLHRRPARSGRDAAKLFNYITGYLEPKNLRQLVISPAGHAARAAAADRCRDRCRESQESRPGSGPSSIRWSIRSSSTSSTRRAMRE